jgi:hypothetical protein
MERISGPYKGYFIAAYSVEAGKQFVGYAKVCVEEPDNVWMVDAVEKLTSATALNELDAVSAAERKARRVIADLTAGWDSTTSPGSLEN